MTNKRANGGSMAKTGKTPRRLTVNRNSVKDLTPGTRAARAITGGVPKRPD